MMNARVALRIFLVVAFLPGITACPKPNVVGVPRWQIDSGTGHESEKEVFYSFPTPRTSHPAGYIYRTSRGKSDVYVTSVGAADREEYPETLPPKYEEVDANYAGGLLGAVNVGVQHTLKARIEFGDCTRETLQESALQRAIADAHINFQAGEKYYVLQTVIKTKSISVEFENFTSLSGELKINLEKLSADGTIKRSSTKKVVFSREFSVPHQVCYKPLRIDATGPLSSGTQRILLSETKEGVLLK
jgi:hypothetical protein